MRLKLTSPFKLFLIFFIGFVGCRSYDSISEEKQALERSRAVYLLDTTHRDRVDINLSQGSTNLNLVLFFDDHEFELEFDKTKPIQANNLLSDLPSSESSISSPSSAEIPFPTGESLKSNMIKVMGLYQSAQEAFYNDQLTESLSLLDSALSIMPSSNVYALKGSILFTLNEPNKALEYWNLAKKLDPAFIVPTITRK